MKVTGDYWFLVSSASDCYMRSEWVNGSEYRIELD
jgi:hypothetical protein